MNAYELGRRTGQRPGVSRCYSAGVRARSASLQSFSPSGGRIAAKRTAASVPNTARRTARRRPADEPVLLDRFQDLPFKPFEFHGFIGNRRVVSFSWRYDFAGGPPQEGEPVPRFLRTIARRTRPATYAGHVCRLAPPLRAPIIKPFLHKVQTILPANASRVQRLNC